MSKRVFDMFAAADYLCLHQINSGLSFGVFDTEYEYETEEAKKVGGKLYWDRNEPSIEEEQGLKAEGDRLLAQMDFPLISVALS
ncbi:Nn.00g105900.m01.CDS01 [Neocucurbitaria sp. VM-36]